MKHVLLAALAWIFASPLPARELTIFHSNDIHGWIMAREAGTYGADPKRRLGGVAAMANVIRKHKGPKLVLDAGDWYQGTPEGTIPEGRSAIEYFNAVGYDAIAFGNHDLDLGERQLKELVRLAKMPVISANLYRPGGTRRVEYLKPWFVKEVAGVKVGVFGLVMSYLKRLHFPETVANLEVRDEIAEAKDAVAALKQAGATVIVAVTHIGFEAREGMSTATDQALAATVPGIDLIVGGHTHTTLRPAVRDATYGTLITQAGSYGRTVGKTTLEIDDKTGRVVRSTNVLADLWIDEIGEDPEIAALVARHVAEVAKVYDVVIATAAETLWRRYATESPMGDWMTDCYRDWAGSEIAFQNGGGVRSDFPEGPITRRAIFNLMPFDNFMTKLTMNGGLIRETMDHGVSKGKGMLQVSGASFVYDADAAPGSRISGPQAAGAPLDDKRLYTVATLDFMVKGGDNYTAFARAEKTEFMRVMARDVLEKCAIKQGVVRAPSGGRVRAKGDKNGP